MVLFHQTVDTHGMSPSPGFKRYGTGSGGSPSHEQCSGSVSNQMVVAFTG